MAAETRLVKGDLRTAGWQIAFNPNSEVGLGSTGDPPVPDGHWPDGTGRTLIPGNRRAEPFACFPHSERRVAARHRPVACATHRSGHRLLRNSGLTFLQPVVSAGLQPGVARKIGRNRFPGLSGRGKTPKQGNG